MKNKFISFILCIFFLFVLSSVSFADTFTAYNSTISSSNYAKDLFLHYYKSGYYDPLKNWVLISSGNNQYRLFVEKNPGDFSINDNYITCDTCYLFYFGYHQSSAGYQSYYEKIDLYDLGSTTINLDDKQSLGSLPGLTYPDYASTVNFHFMIIPLIILICFVIMFFVFRIRFNKNREFKL